MLKKLMLFSVILLSDQVCWGAHEGVDALDFTDVDFTDSEAGEKLRNAASEGQASVVGELLAGGVNVNSQNFRGESALLYAAQGGHTTVVEQLLKAGAAINSRGKHFATLTALMMAARGGHTAVVEQLLAAGAKIDLFDSRRQTALGEAIKNNRIAIVERLIAAGANVNVVDAVMPNPALVLAVAWDRIEIVKRLLAAPGVNINIKDEDGKTALDKARKNSYEDIEELLLAAGAV